MRMVRRLAAAEMERLIAGGAVYTEYRTSDGAYLARRHGNEVGDLTGEGRSREEAIVDLMERESGR